VTIYISFLAHFDIIVGKRGGNEPYLCPGDRHMTTSAAKFLAKKPTLLDSITGTNFYECPRHGDDTTVLAIVSGVLYDTEDYDVPTVRFCKHWTKLDK
tara:strand:- start:215 stop:508 length:294 start_codon:yes stop_codon:yes gene_type:complete